VALKRTGASGTHALSMVGFGSVVAESANSSK
jgi:hypothetical protein